MNYMEILSRIYDEDLYFRYVERDIVLHSVPSPELHFYVKSKNGKMFKLTYSIDILLVALKYCIPISREQYEAF
jgi:hypothetical protein